MVHADAATPGPRARRHEANVERILEAATTLVGEGGLAALSMARLADAVDFTPGALYRYYGSKDALLAAMVGRHLDEARGFLAAAEATLPRGTGPLARLAALVAGYRAFARERPQAFGLIALTIADPKVLLAQPEDAAPVTERALAALEPLAAALGEAAAARQLSPGDVFARTLTLFALLQGLLPMQKLSRFAPEALSLERLVPAALRALLLGWGASARAVDAALRRAAPLEGRTLGGTP